MIAEACERYNARASLELAEDLAVDYSAAVMRRFVIKRTARGRLFSAWNHVEYGVNQSGEVSDFDRMESLDCVQALVAKILSKHEAHVDTHLGALVLASYMPVFRKRAFGEAITRKDCVDIYESLAGAFTYIRPLEHGAIPSTLSLETLVLALSARTQSPSFLLFPTSPREEASELQEVNHDSYFVRDRAKLPVQQKLIETATEYEQPITMLTLLPLVNKASRKSGYLVEDGAADQLNTVIALVVAEGSGEELEKHEKVLLDTLSESVVAHYREADARINALRAA